MITPPAYILSGGRSSRFGSDKARATFLGRPLILHAASSLEPYVASITVVADTESKYADLHLRTIADSRPRLGPLGGLEAALADCPSDCAALITSCDLVLLQAEETLANLLSRARQDSPATVYKGERWHPFPGLYSSALLTEIRDRLQSENRSLRAVLDEFASPLDCPPFDSWGTDTNTPEALDRAQAMITSIIPHTGKG